MNKEPETKGTNIRDFTTGGVPKQLVLFATPLFLSSLLQVVYNMADMIIVGQKLGKMGLSAVSIGGDVTGFLTFIAMGFAGAGQVIISQYIGSGQRHKISRFIGTMFCSLMICAVVISAVCLSLRTQLLTLMNTPPEAFDEAMAYSAVSITGLVFIYGYNIISAVLRGMGDSIRPFYFIGIAAVGNIILDIIFVWFMGLGSMGAALATVISQAFSFISCTIYVVRHKDRYELTFSREEILCIDRGMLADLARLGIPMAIKFASITLSKLFVNSFINSYGVAVSAFSGIAHKIATMANMVSNSFNTAGSSMVGQNIGAGKFDRVGKVMKAVFSITFTIAAILSAIMIFFPEQLFGIFTTDEEVIAIGLKYVPIGVLMFMGSAARSGMNALINGSGNYKVNFVTAILDGIIMRIGLALLFGITLGMKYYGFWLGDALAGFTPLVIGSVFYATGRWKKRAV